MIALSLIVLILLGIISVIDLIFKKVPSILLTATILVVAMVNLNNIELGIFHIAFGIIAFIFAYFLYEADFFGGIADIKVLVIIGMMINTLGMFFLFIVLIMSCGILWKMSWKFAYKGKSQQEIPFIIPMLAVYLILYFVGGII